MLHALTEIHRILQIEENISVSCQTLAYTGSGMSLYISFQNRNTQQGTGKFIYKPSILDEKQLHLKQNQSRSHKRTIYPMTITTLQHMLLLTENKRKLCASVPSNCMACDYSYSLSCIYSPNV